MKTPNSISQNCLAIIQHFERCKLKAYICPAGYWTIGWGHVIVINGRMLQGEYDKGKAMKAYPNGITQEKANDLLAQDVSRIIARTNAALTVAKVRPLEQHEFDAVVSLCFNCGTAPIKAGKSIPNAINANDPEKISYSFGLWNKSDGEVSHGLTLRRAAEAHLFNTGDVKV